MFEKMKARLEKAKDWCVDNKELLIVGIPVMVGAITGVAKMTGKYINTCKQEQVKNLYCYDRSLGHYWKLRREVSNDEWLAIDKRKANGERLADILESMKVLK